MWRRLRKSKETASDMLYASDSESETRGDNCTCTAERGREAKQGGRKRTAEGRRLASAHFFGFDVLARYLNWLVEKQLYPCELTYLSA